MQKYQFVTLKSGLLGAFDIGLLDALLKSVFSASRHHRQCFRPALYSSRESSLPPSLPDHGQSNQNTGVGAHTVFSYRAAQCLRGHLGFMMTASKVLRPQIAEHLPEILEIRGR